MPRQEFSFLGRNSGDKGLKRDLPSQQSRPVSLLDSEGIGSESEPSTRGSCNLTPPQSTIFGETTHPCAYPGLTPLPVPDPNNWRQCQGKTSPLANPTLVVKEIMFQSQVVLIFSKFLIFSRSED